MKHYTYNSPSLLLVVFRTAPVETMKFNELCSFRAVRRGYQVLLESLYEFVSVMSEIV